MGGKGDANTEQERALQQGECSLTDTKSHGLMGVDV